MNIQDIISQFATIGFTPQRPLPGTGLLVATHRLNRRIFLTYQQDGHALAIHGEHDLGGITDQLEEVERFELMFAKLGRGLSAISVRARIQEAGEIQSVYPKLQAILDALSRIGDESP